ncbi:hypothetical protein [Amorphus sp. 3PC139-8]|uniref:hypothetical protein n=1 Tax=Amorphus sp. 3PC139-8 TaxID=2735676 RepID=UPI00345C8125
MLQVSISDGTPVDAVAAYIPNPLAISTITRPPVDWWDWSAEPIGRLLTSADLPAGVTPRKLLRALSRQDRPWFPVEFVPREGGIGRLHVTGPTSSAGLRIGVFVLAAEDGWGWTRAGAVRAIDTCLARFVKALESGGQDETIGLQGLTAWARSLGRETAQ